MIVPNLSSVRKPDGPAEGTRREQEKAKARRQNKTATDARRRQEMIAPLFWRDAMDARHHSTGKHVHDRAPCFGA
jgi:hypothetical protein